MLFEGSLLPALLTWVALLVGVGWFGGQVGPAVVTIASDFLTHTIVNSIASTTLVSLNIPANTVTGLQILRYDVIGHVENQTGINQNFPTFTINVGGNPAYQGQIIPVMLNSTHDYFFRITMLLTPNNGAVSSLWAAVWFSNQNPISNVGASDEFSRKASMGTVVFNAGIGNTIDLVVTNAVANALYATTIESAQLQAT